MAYSNAIVLIEKACFNDFRYKEAEPLYRKAVEERRKELGPTHPHTLGTARVWWCASLLYNCCLSIQPCLFSLLFHYPFNGWKFQFYLIALPPLTSTLIDSLEGLADCISDNGWYAEAQPMLQKVCDGRLEAMGEQHPRTLE